MLDVINGKNYLINILLAWGTDSKDISATLTDNSNSIQLSQDRIMALDIYSSLAYPFFRGSFEYSDTRENSAFRNLIDMPAIYGRLQFSMVSGSDIPGSDNVLKLIDGESFTEDIFVTGINTIDSEDLNNISIKVEFVSSDYLKFIANMGNISTYEGYEKQTKPLKKILMEMFGAVGLSERLDADSITIDVEIPYVSSENDTLLGALDYIYRKIFDYNFADTEGKTYCRLIYDCTKQKYVLWKFDDVGTKKGIDSKIKEPEIKFVRECMSVSSLKGSRGIGLNTSATIKSSGNQSVLFEMLDNLKYTDYDYLGNKFTVHTKEENGKSFMPHDDEMNESLKNKMGFVMNNGKIFKENEYTRTFSTSRQNASLYDIYTEIIFKSSFIRAVSDGSIGRRAGNLIMLTFNESTATINENIFGDYLITAIHNHYSGTGVHSFHSVMDLYRPYCQASVDNAKWII